MPDQVRVLRVIEYVGDREWVEKQVENSLHGQINVKGKAGSGVIRAATIGIYPEVLEQATEPARGGSEVASINAVRN